MTGEAWWRLQTYVALRRAVGFTMRPEAQLLQDFVEHLERRGHDVPVAQVAVEWASASTESQHAGRLSIVRGFLRMVRAAEPGIEVPGPGLVRTSKRPTPRILDPNEIVALMEAARSLGPRGALRPHTVTTVIGLLASCELRASEAIRLDIDDVELFGDVPCLQIDAPSSGSRASCRSIRRRPPRCGPTPSNAGSSATTACRAPSSSLNAAADSTTTPWPGRSCSWPACQATVKTDPPWSKGGVSR